MENNQQEQKQEDQRNIAEKNLDHNFEILLRIEDYMRMAMNGCITLMDYVQDPNLDFAVVQEKNYQLFMMEAITLLHNVEDMIKKEDYLKIKLKMMVISNKEKDVGCFLDVQVDEVAHMSINILKNEFEYIKKDMSELRGLFVKAMFPFLDPTIKKKKESKL